MSILMTTLALYLYFLSHFLEIKVDKDEKHIFVTGICYKKLTIIFYKKIFQKGIFIIDH